MTHDDAGHRTSPQGLISGAIGPEAPDELSGLKTRFPRYWMRPVRDGYVAVPRGTHLVVAATIEELAAKLQRP